MRTKSLVQRDLKQPNAGDVEANPVSHNAAIGCGFESRSKDCSIQAELYIEQFTEPFPNGIRNGFRDFDLAMLITVVLGMPFPFAFTDTEAASFGGCVLI